MYKFIYLFSTPYTILTFIENMHITMTAANCCFKHNYKLHLASYQDQLKKKENRNPKFVSRHAYDF